MHRRVCCLVLLAVVAGLVEGRAAWAAGRPLVTSKTRFRIPFKVDAAALQRMNAKELQLFVSQDKGEKWSFAQSSAPDTGKFDYQTAGDGEYWFSVKTLDGSGQLQPGGKTFEPGLMVVVDSSDPQLDLTLEQTVPGKIQLSWTIADANLDAGTLKLEFIQPGSTTWQPVSVLPRATGNTTWSVNDSGVLAVRGSVLDMAGNSGRAHSQLQVGGPNGKVADPTANHPVADASLAAPIGNEPTLVLPPDGNKPPRIESSRSNEFSQSSDFVPVTPGAISPPLAANERSGVVSVPGNGPAANPRSVAVVPNVARQTPGDGPKERWMAEAVGTTAPTWRDIAPSASGSFSPAAIDSSTAAQADLAQFRQRTLTSKRVVNARRFQIGYTVDDVGVSGVGAVELYITQDGGQKWYKYGDDEDLKSPCEVEVPSDGDYGFTIRVRSGAGLGAEPPSSGEMPTIVVSVDKTAPQLELGTVQQGDGASINQVLIRWRMFDAHPAEKPIAIYYAASREGPWETVCGWRADTGHYVWSLGTNLPMQIYVRVVARDAAGNISKVDSAQPLMIDLARPTARILDVEASGGQ